MNSVIKWVKKNRLESVIIFLIILLAAFLRFYRLSDFMTYRGDEGRDALIIKDILVSHIIPSIGPPSSVGNIYLGPLYYYMMAVAMAIFWLNPVAAAGMVALIGVMAVGLIYYLSRIWFGMWSAILSSTIYAISFVTVTYARSSWNPNPAPFFTLLVVLSFYKARQTKNFLWLIFTGIFVAAAVQMHYLALILIPIFGLLWIVEFIEQIKVPKYINFFSGSFLAILSFIAAMMPLILFDFRHNFMNYRGVMALLTQSDSSVGFSLATTLGKIIPIYNDKLIGRYIGAENSAITLLVSIIVIFPLALGLFRYLKKKKIPEGWPLLLLGAWLFVGLLGMSLFKLEIYDHYLGFLSPAPFLLLGCFTYGLKDSWKKAVVLVVIVILGFLNLQKSIILQPANNQLQRTQEIARFILNESNNKPFNFALISERNYDSAYQFYFYIYGYTPAVVPIDITDQLYVVCEDPVCQPVGNPKYEIAGFGWTLIDKEFYFDGVKIYRLIHNPAQPK